MAESGFDFVAARNAVWDCGLSAAGKLVLVQIIEHQPNCHPGIARFCHRTSLSRATIIREIHTLESLGCVQVARLPGLGNCYSLPEGWEKRLPVPPCHQCPPGTGATMTLPPVSSCNRSRGDTGFTMTPDPSHHETGVVSPRHRTGVTMTPKAGKKQEVKQEEKQEERTRASRRPSSKVKSGKAETALPADWQPSAEHKAFAAEHRIDIALEAVKFRGYYDGKTAVSWNGRFATWLGNAVGFARERGSNARRAPVQQGLANGIKFGSIDEGVGPQPNDPSNRYVPPRVITS